MLHGTKRTFRGRGEGRGRLKKNAFAAKSLGSGIQALGRIVGHRVKEQGFAVELRLHWTGSTDNSEDDAWLPQELLVQSPRGAELVRRYGEARQR